jgi:RimJ/RimL family protein N-acetyltransferase
MKHYLYANKDETLRLRPISVDDISDNYISWFYNEEVIKYTSHAIRPKTDFEIYDYVSKCCSDDTKALFGIYYYTNAKHVGNVILQDIDNYNRKAELAIMIGDPSVWGQGIGTTVCKFMLSHAFDRLNMHSVWLGTASPNYAMQKVAVNIGMKLDGVRRHAYKGKYDVCQYSILENEFVRESV